MEEGLFDFMNMFQSEFERAEQRRSFLQYAEEFFQTEKPPQFVQDAHAQFSQAWDRKDSKQRKNFFANLTSDSTLLSLCDKTWVEAEKSVGSEFLKRQLLYLLYGDDKSPLY